MRSVKITIAGFGNVGRALVKTIALKREELARRYGVLVDVVGVADSKGVAVNKSGFTQYELLKMLELPRSNLKSFKPYGREDPRIDHLLDDVEPDIHVEVTPSSYDTGEPGYTNIVEALKRGINVVTANKAPLALRFSDLVDLAQSRRAILRYGATVMGGSPFIAMLISMKSREVIRVEGILNATTNYILTLMEEELVDFDKALQEAQAIGVAEPDPSLDIKGVDPAAKLAIIANTLGCRLTMKDIEVEPLDSVTLKDVLSAMRQGLALKYVAELDVRKSKARVSVKKLARDSLLAKVRGTDNGVVIETDVGFTSLIGKGGGAIETAHTILDDILNIAVEKGG